MGKQFWGLALVATCAALPAAAQDRDYCPTRPGLGTPPCTIAPGRVSAEVGLAAWERDDTPSERSDTLTLGDSLLRFGVARAVELQLGWTPFGQVRTRDKATGAVTRQRATGDVRLGVQANLANPDGAGFSIALSPYVTLPTGKQPVGAGDWGAGLLVPMSADLNDALNLQFTPEIQAAVDAGGHGRHLAYSGTIGLGIDLGDAVSTTIEFRAGRDEDPAGHSATLIGALSLGWMANDDLQLDIGANAGLNHDTSDAEVYVGVSRRF